MTRPRILVVQRGARHGYAIPRMLSGAGQLEALYTDSCACSPIGRAASVLGPLAPKPARRLAARRVRGVPSDRVRATDALLWHPDLRRANGMVEQVLARDRVFSDALRRWGVGEADTVYSMLGEAGGFLREARALGLRIAVDIYIDPRAHRIVEAERAAFPEWGEANAPTGHADFLDEGTRRMIEVADVFTCPSAAVMVGLKGYGVAEHAMRLVPYSAAHPIRDGAPERGRILFAGSAGLRKGAHYLAFATDKLRRRGVKVTVEAAGEVRPEARELLERYGVRPLGRVPRPQMPDLYARADVFVLPTLAEGSASVVYEAMAAGVPVVTTPSAGSIIRDGTDGLIVPERDPDALADAIQSLVEDRDQRDRLAEAARETMRTQSEATWQRRLVDALAPPEAVAARRAPQPTV